MERLLLSPWKRQTLALLCWETPLQQLPDRGSFSDLDVVSKPAAVVVDLCGVRDYAELVASRHP